MDTFYQILLLAYGIIAVLAFTCYKMSKTSGKWNSTVLPIIGVISSCWALGFSWIWFYYIALYTSVPAFLLGIYITWLLYKNDQWSRTVKILSFILITTLIIYLVMNMMYIWYP